MKYYILFFLLLFVVNTYSIESREDELLRRLTTVEGEEKLKILHALQQTFLYESKDQYYNNQLLEEAKRQGNKHYQSIALTSRTAYYYRQFDTDSMFYYAEIAEKFDIENGQYQSLARVKELLIRRYVEQGHYSLGLKKAFEIKDEAVRLQDPLIHNIALVTLSFVYQNLGQYEESIHYSEEALKIYPVNEVAPYNKMQAYALLITSYKEKNDNEKVFLYTDSMCNECQYVKENYPVFNLTDFELSCVLSMAYYYIETRQLKEAWDSILEGDRMMGERAFPYFIYIANANRMRYYTAMQDYKRGNEYYDICYDFCKANQLESETRSLLRYKAEVLNIMGDYDKSNQGYQDLFQHIDSVNRERFIFEINQLRMEYELDKREDEIRYQQERIKATTRFNLLLIVIVLLLLTLTYVVIRNLRIMKDKNYSLFNQIAELTNTKKELMEFKEKLQSYIPATTEDAGDTPEDRLFQRIENFMKTENPYTQPVYGRKELVIDMNTNEVYLARAIRKGCDLTVHEYINRWRMEYAKQLLLENMNLTVEAVANDSGFASIRNFYRLFREQNGMSPAEFRNYVVDNYKQK